MKDYKKLNSLDTLEKEMHLLELEAKVIEGKLNRNVDHLQENYLSMIMESIFSKREKAKDAKKRFWKQFIKTEGFNEAVNTFSENVAEKAGDVFNNIAEKFLRKKEH